MSTHEVAISPGVFEALLKGAVYAPVPDIPVATGESRPGANAHTRRAIKARVATVFAHARCIMPNKRDAGDVNIVDIKRLSA